MGTNLFFRYLALFSMIACSCAAITFADETDKATGTDDEKAAAKELEPTHKQVRTFQPQHDGKPIGLNTFCLDREGNILAAVGGAQSRMVIVDGKPKVDNTKHQSMVQIYSPDFSLLKEIELEFMPTAISIDGSGNIFVGGDAKIIKMTPEGKILSQATSPVISDIDQLRKDVAEGLKEQAETIKKSFTQQVDRLNEQAADLKEKDEEDLTDAEKARLKAIDTQIKAYEKQIEMYADQFEVTDERIDQMIQQKLAIKSIGVNEKDVFVTCSATKGYGYEVWRMNHELAEPELVVKNLSGCCGQMDIQAAGDQLLIAENTKFRVGIYNRDGKLVSDFGQRDRTGEEGFGSCCNPMNIRCCTNGDILTAESSIGTIKRFNSEGELVGLVGKAKIGGGCKHVALGFDEKRNRYYMMYEDEGSICVLLSNEEAPAETADEMEAKQAAKALGNKLNGKWQIIQDEDEKQAENGFDYYQYVNIEFKEGNQFAFQRAENESVQIASSEESVCQWNPEKKCDSGCVTISIVQDQVESFKYDVTFIDEDHINVKTIMSGQTMLEANYQRVK